MLIDLTYITNMMTERQVIDLCAPASVNEIVEELIDISYNQIYMRLQGLYKFPISDEDSKKFLARIQFSIVKYDLFSRKFADKEMEAVTVGYYKALKDLDRLAKGEILLDISRKETLTKSTDIPIYSNKDESSRIFSDSFFEGMK